MTFSRWQKLTVSEFLDKVIPRASAFRGNAKGFFESLRGGRSKRDLKVSGEDMCISHLENVYWKWENGGEPKNGRIKELLETLDATSSVGEQYSHGAGHD